MRTMNTKKHPAQGLGFDLGLSDCTRAACLPPGPAVFVVQRREDSEFQGKSQGPHVAQELELPQVSVVLGSFPHTACLIFSSGVLML